MQDDSRVTHQEACSASGVSRRAVLGAALAAPAVIVPGRSWAADQLVFVGSGGANQDAYEKVQLAAFTRDTGIKVIVVSGPDLAKLKAQVVTGNIEWDALAFDGVSAVGAERQGLLEPIDYSIVKPVDGFLPNRPGCFPCYTFWGGVAYDPNRHPRDKVPATWPQFWDAKTYPGQRGMRDRAGETIEMALLGDGVQPHELYPLDIDRAFRSLDRIKPYVLKFINQTPQTITLVQTGEIDFSYAYAGRVNAAQRDGLSMEFVSEQPIVIPNYVAAVKGTRNRVAAMKLLDYFMRPDMQAAYANMLPGNSPIAKGALPLLQGKARTLAPDLTSPQTTSVNVEWWADNFDRVNRRLKEWLLT
ncbi:MAG: ABC transporter substrate-binding protein [Acidisphaera sp.]|nr:ABC transporter substrate-binding protein [Acidisphaera sp.]